MAKVYDDVMKREEVYQALYSFVVVMKEKLDENIAKGKAGWRDLDVGWLWMRTQGEMGELYAEILAEEPDPVKVARECADVANFLMMIADKVKETADGDGSSDSDGTATGNRDTEGEAPSKA